MLILSFLESNVFVLNSTILLLEFISTKYTPISPLPLENLDLVSSFFF